MSDLSLSFYGMYPPQGSKDEVGYLTVAELIQIDNSINNGNVSSSCSTGDCASSDSYIDNSYEDITIVNEDNTESTVDNSFVDEITTDTDTLDEIIE
jgi:hypothetical protein